MRANKITVTKESALTPLYPPYFFKLLVEEDNSLLRRVNPFTWYLFTSLKLYWLGTGFARIMFGFFLLMASAMGIPWAGHPAVIIAGMLHNYVFSLFIVWFIKRDSF